MTTDLYTVPESAKRKSKLARLVCGSVLAGALAWAAARAIAYPAAVAVRRSQENFSLGNQVIAHQFLSGQQHDEVGLRSLIEATEKKIETLNTYAFAARPTTNRPRANPFGLSAPAAAVADSGSALLQAVNRMQLQSITMGHHNACLINWRVYHEQEKIGQFTIDQIAATVVILRCGQYCFELPLQK